MCLLCLCECPRKALSLSLSLSVYSCGMSGPSASLLAPPFRSPGSRGSEPSMLLRAPHGRLNVRSSTNPWASPNPREWWIGQFEYAL